MVETQTSMAENKKSGEVAVTVRISGEGGGTESPYRKSADLPSENAVIMPSPNRPPKIPNPETLTKRKSLIRSNYSKPKSRFGEQSLIDPNLFDEIPEPVGIEENSGGGTLSEEMSRIAKTPSMASPGRGGDDHEGDEEEEIYKKVSIRKELKYKNMKMMVLFEWLVFLFLLGCVVSSLTVRGLKHYKICSFYLWKWLVLVMVIICGMLVTNWLMNLIVLLIELNFFLRKKVLYFVHGLKKSVQVCIWLIVVLVTWTSLFTTKDVERSKTTDQVLDYMTWTIISLLVGAILWVLKTLLLKILASSFHVSNFFERIQESFFHQYLLLTLLGRPVMESQPADGANASKIRMSFQVRGKGKQAKTKEVIDVSKLHQIKREKVSAWTMKMLVDMISNSGLSTFAGELEESARDRPSESADKEITDEKGASVSARDIFKKVAKSGSKYIERSDLGRFMIKEEVDAVFSLIDVADKGQIDRQSFIEWVVKVYKDRKALAYALSDTKTAVKQLDKLVSVVLIVIVSVVWFLLTEIASTKVLVLLSSQLVVAAFIFGNTCKTIFEAIVFVFVMHPFDVGDRCIIDGVQLVVEEMNILTTVFLRYDNEKIYYPNSVLSTKPISNFKRSPNMGDNVEFSIDFATTIEKIGLLKDKIKKYLVKNDKLWQPNHNFAVKEIENVNKIKMVLYFSHTMNFQDYPEKIKRKTELVLELKRLFEELNIKCNLLPQAVHLHQETSVTAK